MRISDSKQNIIKFTCLGPNKAYNVHNPKWTKVLNKY